jgi:hypothetical protein
MFTNLINRIIELATGRVVDAVDTVEVSRDATDRLVEQGIDYASLADEIDKRDLSGEIDLSDVAEYIDKDDLASSLAENSDLHEYLERDLSENYRFAERVAGEINITLVAREVDLDDLARSVVEFPKFVEAVRASLPPVEEPKAEATEQTVEVPTSLSERLLELAVERLLTLADEAVRDGRA